MTIFLTVFFLDVIAAFISGLTGHMVWCVINIVLSILMILSAMIYEGRLLNRIKSLEQEVDILKWRGLEMRLSEPQAAVLLKIADRSGMDVWFAVDANGMVHDRENGYRFMKTKEAVNLIHEGMTSYKDYRLTKKDIKVFEDLLKNVNQ